VGVEFGDRFDDAADVRKVDARAAPGRIRFSSPFKEATSPLVTVAARIITIDESVHRTF
jgi:hypothetical protein